MTRISYALGLHMHQPPDNLKLLIEHNEWEAQQIIRCYERAARYAHEYKDVARVHVGFSGILLEQFRDKNIIDRYRKFVDIPAMIERYRSAKNIEIIGMGYYHPIFPLIPPEDWDIQLRMGIDIVREMFGKKPRGFWPSEMAFSMQMIPALVKAGYEYAVVDHVHVKSPAAEKKTDCFKPYRATYNGSSIAIIPRNRDLSNAQESGLDPDWFLAETDKKINALPGEKRRLVTTWSDGENGGWFRQIDEKAGFFGYFFAPLMEKIRAAETALRCVKLSDHIIRNQPTETADVSTGAWNVASTSGYDFSQWNGSESQRRAIEALFTASHVYRELAARGDKLTAQQRQRIEKAHHYILSAETSCYLFWGDAWIPQIYDQLNAANRLLSL